jgi:hypothetical protein
VAGRNFLAVLVLIAVAYAASHGRKTDSPIEPTQSRSVLSPTQSITPKTSDKTAQPLDNLELSSNALQKNAQPQEPTPLLSQQSRFGCVAVPKLKVRVKPGATERVIMIIEGSQRVEIVEVVGGWSHILIPSRQIDGWVSSNFLSRTTPSLNPKPKTAQPSKPVQAAIPSAISNSAIIKKMISESVATYPGNCPCPYFTDRAGRSCGRRSAWSRGGGYAPLCYANDISNQMITDWKARH